MAFQKLQTFDLQEKPLPSHFDKVENRLWVTTKFEPPPLLPDERLPLQPTAAS